MALGWRARKTTVLLVRTIPLVGNYFCNTEHLDAVLSSPNSGPSLLFEVFRHRQMDRSSGHSSSGQMQMILRVHTSIHSASSNTLVEWHEPNLLSQAPTNTQ